jgi:sRNA-binding regulator protein Hfq
VEQNDYRLLFMKKSCFAFLSMAALVLLTANSALATASVTTNANINISADCTGGVYSNLTGPILTEGATADIGVGTIILNVAPGFEFNPAATVNVSTSRTGTGTSPLLTLQSTTATVTTSNITVTVAASDGGTARTVLTWSGIQVVRPTAVSPLATGNMVLSTAGTAIITGITKGTTNFDTLHEVAGTAGTKLGFTTAPVATNVAGVAMANVVVQVQGAAGNNVASNNVAITVALNTGSFASGSTNANTGVNGAATFSNLVINTQGSYTLTASAPATGLSNSPAAPFVVVAGPPSTFQFLQDAPSSILAGTTFPSAVTVQLIDAFGNLISNKTVTLSLLGGGTLSGTTSQPSDGTGVATFGGLSVAQAGTNNALVASISSPSMSITGATFTVLAGSATKLGYTTAPAASTPAGVTMASIVVQIQDAAGNAIASNGVPITVALNAGAFTTGTTTVLTGPSGSATFSDLLINVSGNYTLTASSAGNIFTATAPAPFVIAVATPSVIQITQDAPAVATAGTVFSPAVTVHVADSLGNPATNTLVTLSLLGGGTLSGTVAHVTDLTGVATFNNLSISLAGTNYALVANSTNSLSVTGNTFTVTSATGSKLVYTSVPAVTNVAGSTLSNFVVQVQDPFNNNVSGSGVPIGLTLSTNTFASGTTNLTTDPNGSATFSNLVITVAGNDTVTASSAGLTSANKLLVILPAPFTMTFQQDAPSVTNAGAVFTPPVAVKIVDAFNNALTNRPVTLSLLNGGTLGGTTVRTTGLDGVAAFSNLFINVAGTNYALLASATNSMSVTGATFVVTPATPTKLAFTGAPAVTNVAGSPLTNFVMQVQDQFSNPVPTNGVQITMTLSNGTFASGTTITNTDPTGSATIGDLVITNAGNNRVIASSIGLTSTNKIVFITPATLSLAFLQDAPSVTTAGAVFTPPVTVKLADQYNNMVSNRAVTMLVLNGSLSGTLSQSTAINGVATFNNLNITAPSNNYALVANSTNSLSVTGATFTVTVGPPSKLAFTQLPPANNVAGITISTFVLQVEDAQGNKISTNNVPVTMSLSSGTFSSGTTNMTTQLDGSAAFGDLAINNAGTVTMFANSPGLPQLPRNIFITPTNASVIAFVQQPPAVTNAGAVFTPAVTVKVTDQYNNAISNLTVTVSLNSSNSLNGTTSQLTSASGVATFTNLSVNLPGTGYSLTATNISSGLSVNSANFNINVGPIAHYVVTAATPQTRGVGFGVTVTAQDVAGNTVPDSSTVVTMSSSSVNVQFDSNTNSIFGEAGDNTQVLSNGTFTISTIDNNPESVTITATDTNGKTGSTNITVNTAIGDYRSATNGNWNATTTWQVWSGSNWVAASITPAGGAGTNITIQSTHTVTDNVAVGLTGTLIAQGSLSFSTGSISVGSGGLVLNSGTINSTATTLIFNSGATYQHAENGGTIPTAAYNSNSLLRVTGITSTITMLPASGIGGNVEWNCPNQTVGSAIFLTSSTTIGGDFNLVSTGSGSIIGGGSTVRNLTVGGNMHVLGGTYNALGGGGLSAGNVSVTVAQNLTVSGGDFTMLSGLSGSSSASGALTVGGNLSVGGGTLTILTGTTSGSSGGSSMTVSGNTSVTAGLLNLTDATSGSASGVSATLRGNLTISGGTISRGGSLPATVNFGGTSRQTYSKSAGTISGVVNFVVLQGATVNFGTSFLDGSTGTFTLNSGGAIGLGDPAGITTSGATGNIRVSGTRTYSTGGVYIYNGSASQATGNGLPATASSLIVSNTGGIVTLGANVSVTSNLTVSAGAFDLGGFIANRASNGGTVTVANGAALKIGGTNTFPTNYLNRVLLGGTVEYEGSAQSIPALPYGNLTTSGSSNKTLLAGATSIAGDLNIGVGTTFNAVTNSFSLAGNLTNNGTAYAFSGPQTVTFTGSGTQNVAGASSTSFNTFAIGSASVINLANNNTALEFTIAGLDQAGGTWGSTASGAANPDDANFLGNGTLDVTPPTFGISFLQDAPAVTNAGAMFSPPVTVQLTSTATNLIINKLVTLTLNGGGTLNGTLSQFTGTNGVAVFNNLSINVAGVNYSLTATITNPSLSVTGNVFTVTTASATKLSYTVLPPASSVAGGTLSAFTVQIQDQFNNNISSSGVPITMSLASGTFASGTTPINSDVNGSATFSDLVVTNAGNNILTASSPGLTSTNRSLTVLPAPFAITFQQDAPSVTNAGAVFTPAVAVKITDQFNNVLSNATVTLSLLNGGTLNGTLSHTTTNNGVATFNNLSITVPGTNFALVATSAANSLAVTGNTFTVTTAAASKLIYPVLPPASSIAGTNLTSFTVQVADQFNNSIATNGVPITMSLSNGVFASGTTLSNSAVDGSASFSDLVITNAGNNRLIASAPGLASTNRVITIAPDVANITMTFVQEPPATIGAGSVFTNTVQIVDEFNNGITNTAVTLAPNGFTFSGGTLTRSTAANGVATFNNLSVNATGSNYFITAASGSLTATSTTFNVTVGAIAHYLVTATTPQTRGVGFGVTVTAQDAVNNTVPDSSTVVTMSSSSVNVQFDSNTNSIFGETGDNKQVLSNGTFTISTEDNIAETMTVTATDGTGKTGTSPSIAVNAASGDFRSATNGNWNAILTWQTWNGSNWVAASTTPAGGAGTNITIQSIHTVTDNVAVSLTGTLIAQGTASFSTGGSITVGSGGLVQNSGGINSTAATLIFQSGSTYQHSFTTVPGTIPTAAWNAGSTCQVVGYTSNATLPAGLQIFANFTWNCPNQSSSISFGGTLTNIAGNFTVTSTGSGDLRLGNSGAGDMKVGGNFSQSSGTFRLTGGANRNLTVLGNFSQTGGTNDLTVSGSGTLNVAGNFSQTGGTFTESNTFIPVANVVFNGTGVQTFTSGGAVSGQINFTVNGGATLMMSTNFLGNGSTGTFTLSSGGSLGIGDALGITTSGASGNIRVSGTRTYNTAGNYIYNGPASQVTSNGLPATVSSLTVSNTGGIVTLGSNVSVTSNLTVSAGAFDLGSFIANRISSGGTITVANGAALKVGGTNPFPARYANLNIGTNSTVEYEGSAQSVTNASYGNLTTSGSSTKTLQAGATTIAGELTIGPGTTFDAGTNNFSIAGDWSNNGNFTASGSQTVTFNGSSPQNIDDGTSATTFDNVTINSNSVLNLAFTGSDNVQFLVIGGVTETTGTWGATGSGAANIDNVHFQGTTGTLNVLVSLTVPSSTALITSASPQTYGQPVTFTATVTGTGPVPTGTITFMDGVNTMGTGALNGLGQGSFITNTLPAGLHLITAIYGGDVNFNGSTSGVLSQQISQAGLTVTGITASDKTYDGGTNAALNTGGATLVGVIGSDNVTLNTGGATGFFTDKNKGIGKTVNVSGLTISGTDSGNYSLTQPTTNASIFALSISVTAATNSKTYDGTNTAAASPTITLGSLQGTDIAGFSETYDNKNVGTGKTLTPSGSVIDGNGGNNYAVAFFTANTGSIGTRSITVTAATNTKTYDQTTSAAASPTVTTGSLQGTDTAGFSETYSDKIVATGKTLTPAGSVNDGNSGNNYAVTFTPANTGVINVLSLTVSATGVDKPYDGTTNATVMLSDNRISGDNFSDTYTTASFADANAGSNKTVNVSGIGISGIDATNYTANTTASTTANITVGSLTISADNKSKTAGLPNPTLTASYVGFVGGDSTNSLTTQVTLATTATTNSPVGTYPITVSGAVATNYTISYNSGTLTVVAVPQLTTLSISANQFIFSFPTLSNQLYQVEYKDDMAAPTWTLSGGQLPGTGGSITVTNAITGAKRFFQVDVTPGQ